MPWNSRLEGAWRLLPFTSGRPGWCQFPSAPRNLQRGTVQRDVNGKGLLIGKRLAASVRSLWHRWGKQQRRECFSEPLLIPFRPQRRSTVSSWWRSPRSRGGGHRRFAVGDTAFGVVLKAVPHNGGIGESVAVSESAAITKIPTGIDIASAGVLGLASVAALMSAGAVAPEAFHTVVIAGATDGVGAYAIQMVAARGAR